MIEKRVTCIACSRSYVRRPNGRCATADSLYGLCECGAIVRPRTAAELRTLWKKEGKRLAAKMAMRPKAEPKSRHVICRACGWKGRRQMGGYGGLHGVRDNLGGASFGQCPRCAAEVSPLTEAELADRLKASGLKLQKKMAHLDPTAKATISAKQSAALRRRWQTMTAAEKAAIARKAGKALSRKWKTREYRARMVEAIAATFRDGTRKPITGRKSPPHVIKAMQDGLRGLDRWWTRTRAARKQMRDRAIRENLVQNLMSPEVRERALKNSAVEAKTNPLRGPFETNMHARYWAIRSPEGVPYKFRNLKFWLRHHAHLFKDEDIRPTNPGVPRHGQSCHAYNGICGICPRHKRTAGSWKGWTWISSVDAYVGDLLGRITMAQTSIAVPPVGKPAPPLDTAAPQA
jgi:hypothetical protein